MPSVREDFVIGAFLRRQRGDQHVTAFVQVLPDGFVVGGVVALGALDGDVEGEELGDGGSGRFGSGHIAFSSNNSRLFSYPRKSQQFRSS